MLHRPNFLMHTLHDKSTSVRPAYWYAYRCGGVPLVPMRPAVILLKNCREVWPLSLPHGLQARVGRIIFISQTAPADQPRRLGCVRGHVTQTINPSAHIMNSYLRRPVWTTEFDKHTRHTQNSHSHRHYLVLLAKCRPSTMSHVW